MVLCCSFLKATLGLQMEACIRQAYGICSYSFTLVLY